MEVINNWVECILATIILIGIVEIIVPEGEVRKFVFLVTGVIASIVIAMPLINLFSKDFSLEDVFKIETIEDNSYYIDTLRSTVNKQSEILEEVFASDVVKRFNNTYQDMEISECKISFLHAPDGKIIEINSVEIKCEKSTDDVFLLKKRVAEICEVSAEKVRVS